MQIKFKGVELNYILWSYIARKKNRLQTAHPPSLNFTIEPRMSLGGSGSMKTGCDSP